MLGGNPPSSVANAMLMMLSQGSNSRGRRVSSRDRAEMNELLRDRWSREEPSARASERVVVLVAEGRKLQLRYQEARGGEEKQGPWNSRRYYRWCHAGRGRLKGVTRWNRSRLRRRDQVVAAGRPRLACSAAIDGVALPGECRADSAGWPAATSGCRALVDPEGSSLDKERALVGNTATLRTGSVARSAVGVTFGRCRFARVARVMLRAH
jgi:hypothetical protein